MAASRPLSPRYGSVFVRLDRWLWQFHHFLMLTLLRPVPDHNQAWPYRAMAPFDWAAILRLIQTAFAGMEGRIDPPSSMHKLTADNIAAQAEGSEVWVIGEPPVACIFMTPRQDCLYLGKIAVDSGHRNQGLARALIDMAEVRARALNLPALELQSRVELVENHAAFAALGFQQVGMTTHPGFDRPTSLTFRRRV
jgi:predicted N-acetyltransferase YhbS